jgi:hypothetical protein
MTYGSLVHVTLNTGGSRASARAEVTDDKMAMIKPMVAAGDGVFGGLHIRFESTEVFTLSWQADVPAVRCYLARRQNNALWMRAGGQSDEPAAPWLAVRFLAGSLQCTTEQFLMLGNAARCAAWALIETLPN